MSGIQENSKVPSEFRDGFSLLVRSFAKMASSLHHYTNQGRLWGGFVLDFEHPVLQRFSCHRRDGDQPFICEFQVLDPFDPSRGFLWGMELDPISRNMVRGSTRISLADPLEVAFLVKQVATTLKAATQVAAAYKKKTRIPR